MSKIFQCTLKQKRKCLSKEKAEATALDYDRTAKTTKHFFAKVQNKMHYAVFEKYRVVQDKLFMSDFDEYMLELEDKTKK